METPHRYDPRLSFFQLASEAFFIIDSDLKIVHASNEAKKIFNSLDSIENVFSVVSNTVAALLQQTHATKSAITVSGYGNGDAYLITFFPLEDLTGMIAVKNTAEAEIDSFIFKAAHDIRSPLASILGLTHVAASEIKNDPAALDYISIIRQQAERMDVLLKKIIETTRLRKGGLEREEINFHLLINEVKQSLEFVPGFSEVKIEENLMAKKKFCSDKLLLVSVLQNLIDNAIKYRRSQEKGSYIRITTADHNGGVKIAVEDNGIGIADVVKEEVFKLFFRVVGTQANGTGLGLYTVKQCVARLGGYVELQSKEREGSVFTIFLPSM